MKKRTDNSINYSGIKKYFNIKSNAVSRKKIDFSWIIKIILWTFIISITFSIVSNYALTDIHLITAIIILFVIILIGIVFDILGIAVTAANEKPFHSMASRRVKGSVTAIKIIRNSEKVSSFCNDVIGDIASIISGSTGVVISSALIDKFSNVNETIIILVVTAVISSVMVGGKAIGKIFALNNSNSIVYVISLTFSLLIREKKPNKQR